ncbi:MAG TPA: DUF4349 domain-containing protein [Thermoanaerobaculia bacterium]|jgi:hypothetical protein
MRHLKALGIVLAVVLLGIFVTHRVDLGRGMARTGPPNQALKDLQTSVLAQAGLRDGAPGKGTEEVVVAKSPAWSPPRAAVSGLAALKLIRSAEISIELKSYEDGARAAEAIARSCDGYVSESRASSAVGGAAAGQVTLRVPAERFDDAFRGLASLGKIQSQQVHTQDVTKEYFDLETRLRVERDAETRLREVLRNRTARLSDIVEAEQELTRIVGEIERTEGERLFYDRQVAFSTIAVELHEPGIARTAPEPSALQPIRAAWHESLFLLSSSAAGLIYVFSAGLPWAGVLALVWFLIRRIRARRGLRLAV